MVYKTLIYSSKHYQNNEEVNIFKMQKNIIITGLILDYSIVSNDILFKIGLGENLYNIILETGKGYRPLDLFRNYKVYDNDELLFTIQKVNFNKEDNIVVKIILDIN